MNPTYYSLAIAILLLGPGWRVASAQDAPPDPVVEAPAAPSCGFKEIIRKIVHPTTVTVKHTRVCYEYRDYYEVQTCGAKTPILTEDCPDRAKHGSPEYPSPDCVKFGKPYKRRVLVKYIITEEVNKPKGVVECVKEVVPCGPGSGAGEAALVGGPLGTPPAAEPIPAPKIAR